MSDTPPWSPREPAAEAALSLRRSADSLKSMLESAYQRGRLAGREEAAKAIEAVYNQHGPDRSMHYEEAVEIVRSLPQEGG